MQTWHGHMPGLARPGIEFLHMEQNFCVRTLLNLCFNHTYAVFELDVYLQLPPWPLYPRLGALHL